MKPQHAKVQARSSRKTAESTSARAGTHITAPSAPIQKREDIEHALVNWSNTTKLAAQYSVSRDAIYRHANALGLMDKRRRNVRAALEKIIEKAGEVEVNAAAVVSAVGVLARINGQGQWIEHTETVSLNALFERMTAQELETYARDGKLPE